jgi:hypothetical protein
MMPQRVQAPKGVVHGMGHPGERVPVARIKFKKGPAEEFRAEGSDMKILKNVAVVIPVHKLIVKGGEIDEKGYQGN